MGKKLFKIYLARGQNRIRRGLFSRVGWGPICWVLNDLNEIHWILNVRNTIHVYYDMYKQLKCIYLGRRHSRFRRRLCVGTWVGLAKGLPVGFYWIVFFILLGLFAQYNKQSSNIRTYFSRFCSGQKRNKRTNRSKTNILEAGLPVDVVSPSIILSSLWIEMEMVCNLNENNISW